MPKPSGEEKIKLLVRLHGLIPANNVAGVKDLLDRFSKETRRDLIHDKQVQDISLLFEACRLKAIGIVAYFIHDCMARVNQVEKIGLDTLTPLFLAIKKSSIDLMNLLLKNGADMNWQDPKGRIGIVFACDLQRMEAANLLLKRGANINNSKNQDMCAESLPYLTRALKLGINMKYFDADGNSYFMKAVINGNLDIVSLLLKKDVGIYKRSLNCGSNALDLAVQFYHADIVNYLINNSFYTIADLIQSYEYCGALKVLIGKNIEGASKLWKSSIKKRKERHSIISDAVKDNPALDSSSDIGSEEFQSNPPSLGLWSILSLRVICRIIGTDHPFVKRAFTLTAYCSDFRTKDILTFERVRKFSTFNSSSRNILTNGVFLGMNSTIYMCEIQFGICEKFPETNAPFIENMANLITDIFHPILYDSVATMHTFHIYKRMLLLLLHLIEHTLETGSGKNRLDKIISKIARMSLPYYPTNLLLIAIERGFSFKTIVCLIIAGADVNSIDYHKNTPLHLLGEQPIHLPNREKIQRYLINAGGNMNAANDYGILPRISTEDL